VKRILLTAILSGSALAVFGQGQLAFENANNSAVPGICLNFLGSAYLAPVGNPGFAVALLWYNGASFQIVDTVQGSFPGDFNGGTVTLPGFQSSGTFEIEGWYNSGGNYASYAAAAAAGGSYLGITTSFTAAESQSPSPAPAIVVAGYETPPPGAWDGNLVLYVPEPSTIALAGMGAVTLLLFRRRKSTPNASSKPQTGKIL